MAQSSVVVTEQNPWPWLDPFDEESRGFFHGRDDDTAALLRMVRGAPATVLFGKSGLGKTSLLLAGLFPALRKERLLPVYVRLRHGPDAGNLQTQLWNALTAQCKTSGMAYDAANADSLQAENDWFWLYLHRQPPGLRDAGGSPLQPVFVLDQFEEHFTLGIKDAVHQERTFAELGDLLENRIPRSVAARLEHDDAILDHHDLDTQSYKFLISLREDYLPDLELWSDEMPRLGPNRYRLMPMGRSQALEAITRTGGSLVTTAKANQIVDYLTRSDSAPPLQRRSRKAADIQVEPALLSLVCSGLNAKRIEAGAAQLDTNDLDRRGGEILEQFYDERLQPMPEPVHRLIERELITADGIRLQYPVRSAIVQIGVTQEQIDLLVGQRILRKEVSGDAQRLELVHDRLAAVALNRRRDAELRNAEADRESKADEARRLEAARLRAKRYRWLAIAAAAVLSVVMFLFYDAYQARREADSATAEAQKRRDEALAAQKQAEDALAEARRLTADNKAYEAAITANPALAQSVAASESAKPLVYLLVPRTGDGAASSRLQKQLQDSGYDPQPVEKVSAAPKAIELRYFRNADVDDVRKLAERMKAWNYGDIQPLFIKGRENRLRLRQFEIWFPEVIKSALARLVDQIDDPSDAMRKQAIQALWNSHRASSEVTEQVLTLYQPDRINTLSSNGMFNGINFLADTDPRAWNARLAQTARAAIVAIEDKKPGPRTLEKTGKLKVLLDGLPPEQKK